MGKKEAIPKHRHRWRAYSCGAGEVSFMCLCGERKSRAMTKKEHRLFVREMKHSFTHVPIHKISHDFQKKFGGIHAWKLTGYELQVAVEKWAEKHPTVQVVGCDDDRFASSVLVLIPHEDQYKYMGTSVVYIPQCTGEEPTRLFLYPGHERQLTEALRVIRKASRRRREKRPQEAWKKFGVDKPKPEHR